MAAFPSVSRPAAPRDSSYRLRLRPIGSGVCDCLPDVQDFIQLKAPNAERAMELAHHVTGKAVVDATRIEAAQ